MFSELSIIYSHPLYNSSCIEYFNDKGQDPFHESVSFILARIDEEEPDMKMHLRRVFKYMIDISLSVNYPDYKRKYNRYVTRSVKNSNVMFYSQIVNAIKT